MKIFTGEQIRKLDAFTMEHEPVDSIELMERAAEALAQAVAQRAGDKKLLFCIGKGNNGGDGLAMARMLSNAGFDCSVRVLFSADQLSEECRFNLDRLPDGVKIIDAVTDCDPDDLVVIDAILGSGVSGEVRGVALEAINEINELEAYKISVDLPSGMKTEFGNDPDSIVHANLTLAIEFPKLAMLLPEAGECCGEIEIIPISLSDEFKTDEQTPYYYVTPDLIGRSMLPRPKFSHKGDFGHSLLVCGSQGMYGAALLSTAAALRSGCGLVTAHIPSEVAYALYANAPSAMVSNDPEEYFSVIPDNLERFSAIGVGCGIGQAEGTAKALSKLLQSYEGPFVIDADALNIIAGDAEIRKQIPAGSILTPHPGEFRRLVGDWQNEGEKLELLRKLSLETHSIVILKGAYTMICGPTGVICINPTGTPGMAKGGSGDILTGLLTGLLARGYSLSEASLLGVYLHGRAGVKAADYYGEEAMNSGDIIDFIGDAFAEFN